MKKNKLKILIGCLALSMIGTIALAQGVTTASVNGKVTDSKGGSLPGATVVLVHTPTGTTYGNISNAEGSVRIRNMKVGGPYKLTVSFVGYQTYTQEGITLSLGKIQKIDVSLQEDVTELTEVVISSNQGNAFDSNKNGAQTTVKEEQLQEMPNASRGINDFVRLTPQAAFTPNGGISIAGTNNRYNSIFIDGAASNDVFGLAGNGQNGGQISGLSMISIDALEQIQVSVSPYDVTLGGFSGGSISAVTRSGTNTLSGSVYYLLRNQSLAGKTPGFLEVAGKDRKKLAEFTAKTYGFRLGGPIIKDKLFFFVNGEIQRDQTPNPFDFDTYKGGATRSEVDALVAKVKGYGYDPGSYENTISKLDAEKILVKLDYNINDTHKLTLRHSYNKGENFSPSRSTTSRIRFANRGIFFPSTTHSTTLELNSNFANKSNKLIIGRTSVQDNRDPLGQKFPFIDIRTGDVELGSEQFSTANLLEQEMYTLTNNFTLYKGKHTLTFGTHNEFYNINNVFIRQNFGSYRFNSIADFLANNPSQYDRSYSLIDGNTGDGTSAAAKFKALQLGFYVQDEIEVNDKLKLTGGIRVDIPMFLDDPKDDGHFNTNTAPKILAAGYDLKGAKAGKAPGSQLLLAPRFGFNYDLTGEQTTQIRGGIGIFTSRVPFVWPGAMYNNNGATVGGVRKRKNVPKFNPDPNNQPTVGSLDGTKDKVPQGQMDLFAKDFKFPQTLRMSVAIDHVLPGGMVATAEFIYSKTLNNVFYENLNLAPSTKKFGGTPDTRARFTNPPIDSNYGRIILGSNTSKGYTTNLTLSLSKQFDFGLSGSLSYNFGRAMSVFEGTSSQNSSQWRGVYAINGRNHAPIGRSDFDAASRIVASMSYKKEYLGFMSSTISLFYNGQSGSPFSYTYNSGRFTGEDSRQRALIFVPAKPSDIIFDESKRTAEEQWADLDAFIKNDEYLKTRRGKYAERNEARTPFTHIIDLKFVQAFTLETSNKKKHTLSVSFDIFNFTNLLNKNWGQRWRVPNGDDTSIQLLNYVKNKDVGGETAPTFEFGRAINTMEDLLTKDDSGLVSSRWQMQLGLRYTF